MGTFTGNTVASGSIIYASDHNTLVGLLADILNGGIENSNIASNAGIGFEKISGGSASALIAPASTTPALTNATVGNGTLNAHYVQIGKMVFYYGTFTLGSTSGVGTNPIIALPVAAKSGSYTQHLSRLGDCHLRDPGVNDVPGPAFYYDANNLEIFFFSNNIGDVTVLSAITGSAPYNPWNTGKQISWNVIYEAA